MITLKKKYCGNPLLGNRGMYVGILMPSAFAIVLSFSLSFVSAIPIEEFGFDQHPYYIYEQHGGLMYYNFELAQNGKSNDKVNATLSSSCYQTPFNYTLTEVVDDGWLYSDRITFSSAPACNSSTPPHHEGNINMEVYNSGSTAIPQLVTATLNGAVYLFDTVHINQTLSTETLEWDKKRADGNYATCQADIDNDAVCDEFENGVSHLMINYPLGSSVLSLNDTKLGNCDFFKSTEPNTPCSGPDKKDLWIEFDFMKGHQINHDALRDIRTAFWKHDIRVHFMLDEQIPHKEYLKPGGSNRATTFGTDQVKAYYFGTEDERNRVDWETLGWKQKKQVFHYGLSIDKQKGAPTSSGYGEVLGNDFGISLGGWTDGVKTLRKYQSGTIMHELGHNLGLNHGGAYTDTVNCKPNYVSVMSYSRQLPVPFFQVLNDFSNSTMPTISESALNETTGIGTIPSNYTEHGVTVVYGPYAQNHTVTNSASNQVDWNYDGVIDTALVQVDTNYLIDEGCSIQGYDDLSGFNDWDNLNFDSRGTGNFADGRMGSACKFESSGNLDPNACPNIVNATIGIHVNNTRSPYSINGTAEFIPNWYERDLASGATEITYEVAKGFHISNILYLNQTIQALDDIAFKINPATARDLYKQEIKLVFDAVDADDFTESLINLQTIEQTLPDRIKSAHVGKVSSLVSNGVQTHTGLGKIIAPELPFDCESDEVIDSSKKCIAIEKICGDGTELTDGSCSPVGTPPDKTPPGVGSTMSGIIAAFIGLIAVAIFVTVKYSRLKSKLSQPHMS